MIKILLVDDHQLILDGLKGLLEGHNDIHIIGEALDGKAALRKTFSYLPDVVLLDLRLPDLSGFEICKAIKTALPETKIIALTMHAEAEKISKMLQLGADGYLLKNTGVKELLLAIYSVFQGGQYISREATSSLIAGPSRKVSPTVSAISKLTRREREILSLIIEEFTTEEITKKLFISNATVNSHRRSLLRKLKAKNTAGLVRAAYEFNLLAPSH